MAVTNNKSIKSASTKLASDLATAKAKTTGMDTSRINSAGTYQELSRISKGSRKPTDLLPPGYKEGVGIEPTPTVAPMAEPTPTVAPIQEPPQANAGVITPQEALKNAQASGTPPPQDSGEARSQLGKFMPSDKGFYKLPNDPNPDQVYDATGKKLSYDEYIARGGNPDFSNVQAGLPDNAITAQVESSPEYQALVESKKEFDDVLNQRQSLTQEYEALSKKLGIDSINTELMNMKNVIEGTEDDLRTEITKAGGFATESQVQALTMARNKQLVKNYNNLLETKQMAMETLNTMIGLAAQDRQFAMQAVSQKFQIEQQILNYKTMMQQNAQNQLNKIAEQYGYGALVTGDPWQDALTERTLGLGQGGLNLLANTMSLDERRFQQQMAMQEAQFGFQQEQFEWNKSMDMAKLGLMVDAQGNITTNPANQQPLSVDELKKYSDMGYDVYPGMTESDVQVMSPNKGSELRDSANTTVQELQKMVREGRGLSAVGASRNIYGWLSSRVAGTDAKEFMVRFNNLKSLLSLENIKYLKGQGAISDAERQTLMEASSKLDVGMGEKAFKEELQKVSDILSKPLPQNPNALRSQFEQSQNFIGPVMPNQVKGTRESIGKIPTIKLDNNKVAPLTTAFPQGSTGGQCGYWVRSIVERQGMTYPPVGDTLTEKARTVQKYGVPVTQARPGSVLITAENKKTGHVAYVLARTAKGLFVAESNYGLDGKVKYGRFIPFNSPTLLGAINPTKR